VARRKYAAALYTEANKSHFRCMRNLLYLYFAFAHRRRWPGPSGELQASGVITQKRIVHYSARKSSFTRTIVD